MRNPVVHFEVIGKDIGAMQAFYGKAFGWEFGPSPSPTYKVVAPEGENIGGGLGQCPERTSGYVTFYVKVPDIHAALRTIEDLGGKVLEEPDNMPGTNMWHAKFSDPDGHIIGLTQS